METISSKTQQRQAVSPYLKGLLDEMRDDKNKIPGILSQLGRLEGKPEAVRERLERAYYAAILVQMDAIVSGDDDDKELADEASQLTYHLGIENKYLPAHDYPPELRERNYISGDELKLLQVERMYVRLQAIVGDPEQEYEARAEAELRMTAVKRYIMANDIDHIMSERSHDSTDDKSVGGLIARQKEKVGPLMRKAAATLTLSVITIGVSANTSHAAQKSIIDDESRDSGDLDNKKPRTFKAPIKLAMTPATEAPTLVQASPPSAVRPDGSIRLAIPTVIEAPSQVEASPSPNIHTIPNVPNTPPAAPAPAIEAAPAPPIPEVIIDPKLHGETLWTERQLEQIRDNLQVYLEVQAETGVPWEVMAALHTREYGLKLENPRNGQGIYQLYSTGEYFAPGVVSVAEFKHQTILAANFLKGKAQDNRRVGGPMDFSNPDKIKDTLFAYNGLASDYFKQAARLGFALGAEGSPYVMNMADDQRNSDINPNWGQILHDNGSLERANKAPGAWPLIEGLQKINKIARDQMAAHQAAEAVAVAEAARVAAEVAAEAERNAKRVGQQPELQKKPSADWVFPIAGGRINSHYGDRGGVHHDGIDSPAAIGTDFLAIEDGIIIEHRFEDVTGQVWCRKALDGIKYYGPLPDPVQKTIFVKHLIGDDVYISRYDHLSEFSAEVGDIVKAGQPVGKVGSSGCSTGGHAHIGVQINGQSMNPAELFH